MSDEERPWPSALVNALWGRGARAPKVPVSQAAHFRLALALMAIGSGTVAGVLAAWTDGLAAGTVLGLVTSALLGLALRWSSRDMIDHEDDHTL